MRDEIERLALEASSLTWQLYYRQNESPRAARVYQKAQARYTRRAEYLADYDQMLIEASIENAAYA